MRSPQSRILTRRGIALITVLTTVVLLSILVVSLVGISRSEHQGAVNDSQVVQLRHAAELPANVAIAQLRKATSDLGTEKTWASQPGMIRVFGSRNRPSESQPTGRGKIEAIHRLFSSYPMSQEYKEDDSQYDHADDDIPTDWAAQDGVYTNLNEPVVALDENGPERRYPILDPSAIGVVEGFELDSPPGANPNEPVMPVRWIYVLEDGQFAVPEKSSGGPVTFISGEGLSVPSKDNPIKSRFAFWADDETSKVNINTSSEGVFWDTPRANSHHDAFNFADKQPVRNEFQRYPGHPAMTTMSTILESTVGKDPNEYYRLAPRVAGGGSEGGVKEVNASTDPVDVDSDRLYATVDEFLFHAHEKKAGTPERAKNHAMIDRAVLDRSRFFLTAQSRAPELNLQNRPKMSIWPVMASSGDRNAFDRLLAFCSQTANQNGRMPFYFQRQSTHTLGDPASGFGSSQSAIRDWEVSRNVTLFNYMNGLSALDIPGFIGKWSEKYSADYRRIHLQAFDAIRSGVNSGAYGLPTRNSTNGYFYAPPPALPSQQVSHGHGQIAPLSEPGDGSLRGFGRFATVTEAAVVIYPTDFEEQADYRDPRLPNYGSVDFQRAKRVKAFLLLEFFTPSPGLPSWSPLLNIEVQGLEKFTLGGSNLQMPEEAKVRTHTPIATIPSNNARVGPGNTMAHLSLFQILFTGHGSRRDMTTDDPNTGFAWHSSSDVSVSGRENLSFSGGEIKIILRNHDESETLQTINMDFPSTNVPPIFVFKHPDRSEPLDYEIDLQKRISKAPNDYDDYLIRPGDVVRSIEPDKDAIPKGDFRFYSALKDVPKEYFKEGGKPGEYQDANVRFAMGLRNGNFWQYWGHFRTERSSEPGDDAINHRIGTNNHNINPWHRYSSGTSAGNLVPQITTRPTAGVPFHGYRDYHPITARNLDYARRAGIDNSYGDWDQGFGNTEDGPFINKPDESNSAKKYWNWGNQWHSGGYYRRGDFDLDATGVNHSPNRQIASPIMFGSLPTGIEAKRPWETLLFCPNPSGRRNLSNPFRQPDGNDHIGFTFPRDHLYLENFWMPVVQPFAVSEPFSTAGKINMNYEIAPFRYIKRRTAIRSLLKPLQMMAVHPRAAQRTGLGCYKGGRDQKHKHELRYGVKLDHEGGTLEGFERRFNIEKDLFRSPSEICEIYMVPKPLDNMEFPYPPEAGSPNYSQMENWWVNFSITGDNVRENPYNYIYPRLTTKSNSFRVHYRVQLLRQTRTSDPTKWDPKKDIVLAEQRGSDLIERYIDPNDKSLPDFAVAPPDENVEDYYQYRILNRVLFAP